MLLVCFSAGASGSREEILASEILEMIEWSKPVYYDGVIIRGNLDLNSIDLPTTQVDDRQVDVFKFEMPMDQGTTTEMTICACSDPFTYQIEPNDIAKEAKIVNSSISIINSEIQGKVSFENAVFKEPVIFRRANFKDNVDFGKSQFNGFTDFKGSQFNGYADFCETQFNSNVCFEYVNFGPVNFVGVRFRSVTSFKKSEFDNFAYFGVTPFVTRDYQVYITSDLNQQNNASKNTTESIYSKVKGLIRGLIWDCRCEYVSHLFTLLGTLLGVLIGYYISIKSLFRPPPRGPGGQDEHRNE